MIDQRTLSTYCHGYTCSDNGLTVRQLRRLKVALLEAEGSVVLHPEVDSSYPRLMQAWVTMHPSDVDLHDEPICAAVSVIRLPRYAVRNREAPKRSTLLSRLWSLLR